ncbi:hypothetical protein [uncultured Brevundimonas sp.]|uniref:hypothetical protein n=1 Tax=uncultured Brevundimonas sp. TaxID=213418 RepID=UPI0025EA25F6|nr:hypothetical protein [uncultured Brevundimonas sp.]
MKRIFAVGVLMSALIGAGGILAACGDDAPSKAPANVEVAASADTPGSAGAAKAGTDVVSAQPAAPDAPAFAVLYPDATPLGPATLARGPSGPGGILQFTTPDTPEAVVSFYRARAEASGLNTIASMNQGGASAYSAGDGANGAGKLLSVVASPGEGGLTNVQLDWSSGR